MPAVHRSFGDGMGQGEHGCKVAAGRRACVPRPAAPASTLSAAGRAGHDRHGGPALAGGGRHARCAGGRAARD
jgi:hypothetical protein